MAKAALPNYPVYPILFAAYFVMALSAYNRYWAMLHELVWPLVVILVVALAWLGLCRLVWHDWQKAALLAALLLAFCFLYLTGWDAVKTYMASSTFLVVWTAVFLTAFVLVARSRVNFAALAPILNVVALSLWLCPLWEIATCGIERAACRQRFDASQLGRQCQQLIGKKPDAQGQMPDIYYVILDGCASPDSLKELFAYDDEPFLRHLYERNFAVLRDACSNYPRTCLSLASSLNMTHLTALAPIVGVRAQDAYILNEMCKQSLVIRSLKQLGYRYIHLGSSLPPSNEAPLADEVLSSPGIGHLGMLLFRHSILSAFPPALNWLRQQEIKQRLSVLDGLATAADRPGPKFVFAHLVLPHPPYLFDRNGHERLDCLPYIDEADWAKHGDYVDQLIYLEGRLAQAVDRILDARAKGASSRPQVIVLQADHGPDSTNEIYNPKPSPAFLRERFAIFSTFYLSDGDYKMVNERFTPVNTFRLLFNKYFQAQLPYLPNTSHFSTYSFPYDFVLIGGNGGSH